MDGTESKTFSTLWTYAAGRSGRIRRFGAFLKEAEWQVIRFRNTVPVIYFTTIACHFRKHLSRLNMFRASLCPSSGEQKLCYCISCVVLVLLDVVGSGCGALRCRMRAVLASCKTTCFGIIMPIFRRTKALLLHLVCCSGSAGCGW